MDKIFQTNFRFHVKKPITGRFRFLFFINILLILTKFSFGRKNWHQSVTPHLAFSWYFLSSPETRVAVWQHTYTIFITNNHALFHMWQRENLIKYQKSQNIMTMTQNKTILYEMSQGLGSWEIRKYQENIETGWGQSIVPCLWYRNKTMAVAVKNYAKAGIKYCVAVQFCLISLLCNKHFIQDFS